ncbi:hypothetical protein G3I40_12350 [Streptomyces sp. SID14478]|nr:hypothetical protein [Streptomyces sp. SID14478]NEB76006.1 hypothetical protein [Streptomyces sp. SID14478]
MSTVRRITPQWIVKGVVDDSDTCECCGRTNLKRTVALMPLDAEGNEEGDVSYYGTSCAAVALGWSQTRVANAAGAATIKQESRDEWARSIISRYAPWEFATPREMQAAWFSYNPHDSGPASERVRVLLADARAQLADTTLGPQRPHTWGDFRPFLVISTPDGRVLNCVPVPADETGREEMHRAARNRYGGRGNRPVTLYALSAESAKDVFYAARQLDLYRQQRPRAVAL